jgi:hypothetical protein
MPPVVIDVAGTVNELLKWALTQVLLLLGILIFGLSAPVLFTVGAMWLAWRYPQYASTWAVVYLLVGPLACAIWMVFICHWHTVRRARKEERLRTWRRDEGGYIRTVGKSFCFMIAGFFGSALAESVLTYTAHRVSLIPKHLMLFCVVAPFAVFAPVLLVLLSRWVRRDKSATA